VIGRAALLMCLALPVAAHAYGVQELFQSLAGDKPRRATFQEKKTIALLDKPVESSGELVFTPPAKLEKRTSQPRAESIVVDGDLATIERGGKKQTLRLSQYPGVAVLIDSIRSTLAGDLNALTKTYSAAVAGDAARWRLTLRPIDPSLGTLVEHIEIAGTKGQVRTVEIFQADGDRSVMTLTPIEP
jgi:hypothetical protein